jgi:ATP-dependent 26S proteasome regulatory subunit
MDKMLPKNYPLYEVSYGNEFPVEQYFIVKFDTMPSKYEISTKMYDSIIETYFESIGFVKEMDIQISNRRQEINKNVVLVNEKNNMFVELTSVDNKKEKPLNNIKILYSIKNGSIQEQINFEDFKQFERKKAKSNISLIRSDMGHLDTEDYDLVIPQTDIELNYGGSFLKVHETIIETLNKENGKGIILLHGDPGTGKTSYIKFLTSLVKEKDVLFVPPSMAEMLSEPSIIPFLMDHRNSILVIEDAERVIADREGNGSPAGVSNILNLTDGILGDCLNIQIVATFNMKREKIDPALLRKGRLIAEHKFENLSVDDTNKLLKHLNKDIISDVGLSLADIYNVDIEVHKTKTKSKIGLF